MNRSTVRVRGVSPDTEPCTEPCAPPSEADTWPSPDGSWCLAITVVIPTVGPLKIALALRHTPLPAEYYELVGESLDEVRLSTR